VEAGDFQNVSGLCPSEGGAARGPAAAAAARGTSAFVIVIGLIIILRIGQQWCPLPLLAPPLLLL